MNGEILTYDEIAHLAHEQALLVPFLEEDLNPASYDLHIGDEIFVPQAGAEKPLSLREWYGGRYALEPGQTVVLYSLETVKLPLDVQGLLVLRASWATKGLYYAGGLVKPGYWGRLFFSVTNLSLHAIELPGGEPLASITFFRLPQAVGRFPEEPIEAIPPSFKPLPPERNIYSPAQISDLLDEIRETVGAYRAADYTLGAEELQAYAKQDHMIEPFDETCLKGITYDFRVGDKVALGMPGKLQWIALDGQNNPTVAIPPGLSAVVYSYETVKMPWNVKARLSVRSAFMARRLNYDGGVIDPGYQGRLFFTVTNLGDTPITLRYKERLVTAEFIALGEEVPVEIQEKLKAERAGFSQPLEALPPGRLPRPASEEWDTLQELSSKVKDLTASVKELQNVVREVKLNQRPAQVFMELFVFAALVGLVVALFGQNVQATTITNKGIWLLLAASMLVWLIVMWWKER